MLPRETFTRHWDHDKYRNFREKFEVYTGQVNDALNETDPQKSVPEVEEAIRGRLQ